MLDQLDNRIIGDYRLRVTWVERARYFDQRDFALHLSNAQKNAPDALVFRGRYNAGRASIYVPGWIDGEFIGDWTEDQRPRTETSVIHLPSFVLEEIAAQLGALIPPGGRFWLAYEAFDGEDALMRETRAGLRERVPLLATPIGYLLFRAGCWSGARDWDIPEGGREGPRKLQGNKPLNAEHARQRAREIVPALERFIEHAETETEQRAALRAQKIVPSLRNIANIENGRSTPKNFTKE
jgi:hypothetical protein